MKTMESSFDLSKFTNISTIPLGVLDGLTIKPCMKSGFCCTSAPCGYGEWNEDKSACKFLQPPNELGQRDCGRYDWIVENVPGFEFYPGFGTGCCMGMFNQMRDQVIKNIAEKTNGRI
jgi:hypothetical protein